MLGSEEEDDEREDGQEDMFLDFLLGQGEWFYHIFSLQNQTKNIQK